MSTPLEQLEAAVAQHLGAWLEAQGFHRIEDVERGAPEHGYVTLRYAAGGVLAEVEYDRGLCDIKFGRLDAPDSLRGISQIADLLSPSKHGGWNLGFGESFLSEHWRQIKTLLAQERWADTVRMIDQTQRDRHGH